MEVFRRLIKTKHYVVHMLVISSLLLHLSEPKLAGVEESEDKKSGTLSFKTPTLDDEDAHSLHMPQDLKCDGCRVVAYQLQTKFSEAHQKRPSLKVLPESQIIDITESICESKFDKYGIKDVDGKKRLSGPGLDTADIPGIMQGGGRWPNRLREMCSMYVGEIGEEEIYEAYLKEKDLDKFLCRGKGLLGECSKSKKRHKTDEL
ncbi:marginal zone B- and B1-cell-specific protein-like [Ylistrum balloti]|uniref:marginal zone B- and B1-cell-specific protein-like n=1 Tax=Ylistrum balloti TaxID=509963 RepID=UPI002905DCF6|nr:marginal zone B- and B1-cell-specific protein-like [Ylistrum balloti]